MPSRTLASPPPTHGAINCCHSQTRDIREAPGLCPVPNVGGRVLRTIVFETLQPVRKLRGDEFVKAWIDCVRCHRICGNRAFNKEGPASPTSRTAGRTAFNDWDLASIEQEHADRYLDRTGSIPFMPLELLNSEYWAGTIERTYYQGLESLIWAFTFVLLNFDCDRKTVTKRAASAWLTGDYVACFKEKLCFLTRDVISFIKNPRGLEGSVATSQGSPPDDHIPAPPTRLEHVGFPSRA
ncbi:hypothetical protein FA95DRAFT_886153 [Auriscalpium vulgare]|uniref:Uncharacterized protein n=1 Tax=Auriscalpium vulgare TaxID=40419 RepID=A0ACB8R8Y8_9AGAM|nr:hypothetical protein FA95DRAFT_886153 [Auriscalpium vulgare]